MKRHSDDEVAAKLRHADELVARGQTQPQICKALGISVMTYHRWRKLTPKPVKSNGVPLHRSRKPEDVEAAASEPSIEQDIRLENKRLRRLLTDLLLEKMKLEELLEERSKAKK